MKPEQGEMVRSRIILQNNIQALSGVDIMAMLPPAVLADLKQRDPHPFLQAYSICHEGVSTPTLLGDTARPIHWTRKALQSMRAFALKGIRFFLGHNADNSTEGRPSLGEIVWDGQKEIDGILHHVVIGHFPDRSKVQALDICSQEGEWTFFEAAGQWFADKLHAITGIALANSQTDRPAFAGARRLAMVQAMADGDEEDDDPPPRRQTPPKKETKKMSDIDLSTVPFSKLVQEMQTRQTVPSQLFKLEDLKKDPAFAKVFADSEALDKTVKEREAELKKLKDEKLAADKALAATTAKTRFETMVDSMTLTPKQKTFVKESFPKQMEDVSDAALKTFIEGKLEDFKVAAKAFNVTDELPAQGGAQQKAGDKDDLTKAANNPLLEEDAEIA